MIKPKESFGPKLIKPNESFDVNGITKFFTSNDKDTMNLTKLKVVEYAVESRDQVKQTFIVRKFRI